MKASDLKHCALCKQGVMHSGSPMFYEMRVNTLVVDLSAVQQVAGMEMIMGGNAALARAMGTDPDIATEADSTTAVLCSDCLLQDASLLRILASGEQE